MGPQHGIVLRVQSGRCAVLDDDGAVVECRARRRLRRPDPSWPEFPVAGDDVEWRLLGSGSGVRDGIIEAVRPRRTEISRSRFGNKHVVVANLDQLVVVVAVRHPSLDRGLLDRLLATAERIGVKALVCLHKADLASPGEFDAVREVYTRVGYGVLLTSVETGAGIDELRAKLRGVVSAFMGPSGAGKSHLIGQLQPGLKLRTGSVNEKTGQGKHTTTQVDLHRTDFGALLADTPGVREFGPWRLDPQELRDLFPEFRSAQKECLFASCTHDHEPECAVKTGVESGAIDPSRHRSYLGILEELQTGSSALGASRGMRDRKVRKREMEKHDERG
jgi:ribosome biogenesis GTPase